ncbi:hypothetical protein SADUNF_Sadunf17G0013100 [Salix dunnii]|uniref:Uncharacterized protein n=1 Tax=Salix dunnii TaxID=1413687 RepID=A0A835J512_9ROSI|nr:hypothetical protein SADUNF_Sadunf17G0013100 [Salix dunnii]
MTCHVTVQQQVSEGVFCDIHVQGPYFSPLKGDGIMEAKQSKEAVLLLIFGLFCYRIGPGDVILLNKTVVLKVELMGCRLLNILVCICARIFTLHSLLQEIFKNIKKDVSNGVLAICVSKLAAQTCLSLASILWTGGYQSTNC